MSAEDQLFTTVSTAAPRTSAEVLSSPPVFQEVPVAPEPSLNDVTAIVTRASSYSMQLRRAIAERDVIEIPHLAGHVEYELKLLRKLFNVPEPVEDAEFDTFERSKARVEALEKQLAERLGLSGDVRRQLHTMNDTGDHDDDELFVRWQQEISWYEDWLVHFDR